MIWTAQAIPGGFVERLTCDLLCVSGGLSPGVHLHSHLGAGLEYRESIGAFVPVSAECLSIGGARGRFGLSDSIVDGRGIYGQAGLLAAPISADPEPPWSIRPLWQVPGGRGKRFVDFQNDVTVADLALATREGYRSIEHVKRYTTLGMGTDQGKTSGMNGLAIVAQLQGEPISTVGTTTYRPPYTPVTLGALSGTEHGADFDPVRRSPLHQWHQAHEAVWIQSGLWLRARAFPVAGETFEDAWKREALTVRHKAGLFDVSTLGKVDIRGPDAMTFLDRVYCTPVASLAVGRCRYGLMLREDGIILDDGTITRLGHDRYCITISTGRTDRVLTHLEFLAESVWPELDVQLFNITEQYAQIALAGPLAEGVLRKALGGSMPGGAAIHLAHVEAEVDGVPVRLFRVSYSGEWSCEIAVPADHGQAVGQRLLDLGAVDGIAPCGTEALGALRIEKGHVAGPEIDGRTTPADLGLTQFVAKKKDFIGQALGTRPGLTASTRRTLVGIEPSDGKSSVRGGAQLVEKDEQAPVAIGHVTSTTFSPTLNRPIALALVEGGDQRRDTTLVAASPLFGEKVEVRVVSPRFYDPDNRRLHG